jgi:hypothetical protein
MCGAFVEYFSFCKLRIYSPHFSKLNFCLGYSFCISNIGNVDLCTMHFVEFYYICPTNAQYVLTIICFLEHSYMLRCLYIILREFLITCAKVTELMKWKHLNKYKINPFQSKFSATCILPSSYLFWAGKRLVDYL